MNAGTPDHPHTVLAIDDERASLSFLEISLSAQGYRVVTAKSGKSAVRAASRHKPDIVLLDVMMPDMDGYAVCRAIKDNPATAQIPVIFLSGVQEPGEKVLAFQAGAVDYLIKPVAASELCARIRTHIAFNQKWRQVEERSRAAVLLLQEVFDAIDDAVVISRAIRDEGGKLADFKVEYANQKFARLIGKEAGELVGARHVADGLFASDPPLADCLGNLGNSQPARGSSTEIEVCSPGGGSWKRVSIFALGGDLTAAFIRDISIYKTLQAERAEHQRAMFRAEKMATLGTLVAGVCHEINNPNNVLSMNIPLLEKVWRDVEPALHAMIAEGRLKKIAGMPAEEMLRETPNFLAGIGRASRRIKNIVKLLRDYVRGGDARPVFRPLQINDAIRASAELAMPQIRRATENFSLELAEGLPPITGDIGRIEQVFINLFSNAAESLSSPDKKIVVRSWLSPEGDRVEVEVRDEGEGIPPEVLARIGDPFLTTKHERGGMGLGVSICMRIIEEHDASIKFESERGKGTAVRLSFPLGETR